MNIYKYINYKYINDIYIYIYTWYKFIFMVFTLYHVGHNVQWIFLRLHYVLEQKDRKAGSFLQTKSLLV